MVSGRGQTRWDAFVGAVCSIAQSIGERPITSHRYRGCAPVLGSSRYRGVHNSRLDQPRRYIRVGLDRTRTDRGDINTSLIEPLPRPSRLRRGAPNHFGTHVSNGNRLRDTSNRL
jgi:hypothetical protein